MVDIIERLEIEKRYLLNRLVESEKKLNDYNELHTTQTIEFLRESILVELSIYMENNND